jgi:sulfate adenylyltransferase subunit 1
MEQVNSQMIWKLVKDDLEMITACFDDYYFVIPESVIKPFVHAAGTIKTGERVPISGETYHFPESFNIIDLHFKKVAKIREAHLSDVIDVNEYIYDGFPVLNMMGFSIKLSSQEDFDEFKSDFSKFKLIERDKLAAFANKWFEIVKYRTIKYK